ncbi:MAG: hypothetical protein R2824_19065 [Saprospiraceae bacterium]|nr:hypothetical protein [Lewinella sp.]
MQDHLEQFIQANREAFDDARPSLKVWADIDRALEPKKSRFFHLRRILQSVAAVMLLLVAGALIGHQLSRGSSSVESTAETLARISPDLAELESFYNQQINEKFALLANYPQRESVAADFAQIDETMEELRAEIAKAPVGMEQEIVTNLLRSYKLKVQILERVLERIRATDAPAIDNRPKHETSI